MFPVIKHIAQITPVLGGRKEFAIAEREWGTAIDYMYIDRDTFDEPLRLECRGLKFGPTGELIGRAYHKFFNVGEKPETQADVLPWHEPHIVLEKLDGSMIHMAGGLWMTRMGHTDVAKAAMIGMPESVSRMASYYDRTGITCIFEWCSPRNRIVIRYDNDRWILTGMRDKSTGYYLSYETMVDVAAAFGVEVVKAWGQPIVEAAAFLQYARGLRDAEGFVVRWNSGQMVKIKADEYVLRHKSKDGLSREKNVLALILDGLVDDTVPLLPPEDARTLQAFEQVIKKQIQYHADHVQNMVRIALGPDASHPLTDRKTFALRDVPQLHPLLKTSAFRTFEGSDPRAAIEAMMRKHLGTQSAVDEMRPLFPMEWDSFYRAPKMDN